MRDVSVNIGHLVLSGVTGQTARDGQRLGRMTEAALQHLFAQRGVPPGFAGGDVGDMIAPRLNLPSDASDQQIAEELAHSLYNMFGRLK